MLIYVLNATNVFPMTMYSNHERAPNTHVMRLLERHGLPYYFLPTKKGNKREEEILELSRGTDFLVLARYMQVHKMNIVVISLFIRMLIVKYLVPKETSWTG